MHKQLFYLLTFFIFSSYPIYSQEDTIKQQLKEVEVSAPYQNSNTIAITPTQQLNAQQLSSLPALQLSDALKYFSGVVIKDYGGIGGLKTVSIRGFGSQHTAITYEGVALSDIQTGQIDLSRIAIQNIGGVSLSHSQSTQLLVPARQFASANVIEIETKRPDFTKKRALLDFTFLTGSYSLFDQNFSLNYLIKKKKNERDSELYAFVRANYTQCEGDYPYTLYYGGLNDSTSVHKRNNSDIQALLAESGFVATFKDSSQLNFLFSYYDSERGLPGATIFYNVNSNERLWNQNLFGQLNYQKSFTKSLAYRTLAKFDYAYTHYVDPDFLNSQRYLSNTYIQREYYVANMLQFHKKYFSVALTNDLIYNNLSSTLSNFVFPSRISILTVLAGKYHQKHIQVQTNLLYSCYIDGKENNKEFKQLHRLSPALNLSYQPFLQTQFFLRALYKNIFRMPTFNDLYYRDVGNMNLSPEKVDQFNVGFLYSHRFRPSNITISLTGDYFYNFIYDKIVAIPNKNLFIWSMLNFGKVRATGTEINFSFLWKLNSKIEIENIANYSLEYAVDITDKNSKTYLHQIPYVPLHSGNIHLLLRAYNFSISGNLLFVGERYNLAQNIVENRLAPYIDGNLTFGYTFLTPNYSVLLKAEILNVANVQYEIIKNYPMPGRNFRLKIEFHL